MTVDIELEHKQKGLRIIDILIIQYFLSFAGIFYGITFRDLNLILLFGIQMVFNAALQIRAKKFIKDRNKL